MSFIISSENIKSGKLAIVVDKDQPSGVRKIAGRLASDMKAVFGHEPKVLTKGNVEFPIEVSVGGDFDGKREVYEIKVEGNKLTITGSDKRGAIYGMFKISEMLGVSPFIDCLDIKPNKMKELKLPDDYDMISKEPSVRFRGFFINDEWPAFGNFCNKRFGGFNAKVYEHVFELLLRLKGNYMWPAMWSAIFPNDGPGLANCELADELGVVMGMSHHEPCLRQGEEYKYLRGPKSPYGDAWNFLTNEKGITKFWEDGLKRSGKFENVITVGMRGEADTAIMGKDATLKDNIDLLRNVLKTQNSLIRKYVNKDLDSVPRMLALYKEVEPYFYGDSKTPGLMGDPELDGVTLMLCDDNFGNLRTVPTPAMRKHKGGYGMYYHFDYHGLPVSFEWFNTSHLPKVWEQMTTAYDFGIRDLWIVNVGDIFSNEYPLSFFLDLAYDFDRWGTSNPNAASEYTSILARKNFSALSSKDQAEIADLMSGYTRITSARRTEAMNARPDGPYNFRESIELLDKVESLMARADKLRKRLEGNTEFAFYELVWLPLTANLNVQKMWLLSRLNTEYAAMGSTYAMKLAEDIQVCIDKDYAIVNELHTIHSGKWYGMGLSEHIGFKNWCEEACQYPIVQTFNPANKERLIANVMGTRQNTEGRFWTGRVIVLEDFLDPSCDTSYITLSTACAKKVSYEIECPSKGITVSSIKGTVKPFTISNLKVTVDRSVFKGSSTELCIRSGESNIVVKIPVNRASSFKGKGVYQWVGKTDFGPDVVKANIFDRSINSSATGRNYISILATEYSDSIPSSKGEFRVIPDHSRGMSAMKAYPQDVVFGLKNAPRLEYKINVPEDGEYTIMLYTNPSNPFTREPSILFGISANDGKVKKVNMIPTGFAVGDGNPFWSMGVLDNRRITRVKLDLKKGLNVLKLHAIDPNFVLQKIVILKDEGIEPSYLGPKPTYRS